MWVWVCRLLGVCVCVGFWVCGCGCGRVWSCVVVCVRSVRLLESARLQVCVCVCVCVYVCEREREREREISALTGLGPSSAAWFSGACLPVTLISLINRLPGLISVCHRWASWPFGFSGSLSTLCVLT